MPAKKAKKKQKVLGANIFTELPPCIAANEQIVMEDEGTEKETDAQKWTGGGSDILEGTRRPHKKRKKDKSGSNAVDETPRDPVPSSSNIVGLVSERVGAPSVLVANQIAGKENTVFAITPRNSCLLPDAASISVSRSSTTSDQSTGLSRNTKRKKKRKDSQVLLEPPTSISSLPTTGSKNPPKPQRVPFSEQLADVISETSGA